MTQQEWEADVARRKACAHSWKVNATFSRGYQNLECHRCGHKRVKLGRRTGK